MLIRLRCWTVLVVAVMDGVEAGQSSADGRMAFN
jgi:hypothetical protein